MNKKFDNDSTATFKPIIFQFYIALEKCFEMVEGESVYIEKYGDVTVSEKFQIEVKAYEEDLTDSHENIWKTLKNWLDKKFDTTPYKNLILLTTQSFGKESSFINWNSKDINGKKQILTDIYKKYQKKNKKSEATENLFKIVLNDENKYKLNEILEKFLIFDSSENDDVFYEKLKQKHCKVLSINKDKFINSLLGYIISPPLTSLGWKITYELFSAKVSSLVEEYASVTKIFPKKFSNSKIDDTEQSTYSNHTFVQKIKDIEYDEVIGEAISDFVNTRKTIAEEFTHYQIGKSHYDEYVNELHRSYLSKHRSASRDCGKATIQKDCQNFYDKITDYPVPDFRNFNDTPLFFRNGLLHELADTNDGEKKIVWKLNLQDE